MADSETDPFLHGRVPKPFAWGVYDGKAFDAWWDDNEGFVEWLSEQDAICYAHNGGKFDFHFLKAFFRTDKPIRIINGRIASVWIGKCELRDSWCLCPIPLATHQKDVIDYALFEREEREAARDAITAYLRTDCVSLHELLAAFHAQNPGLPLTLPGAGMRALQTIMGEPTPKGSARFDSEFRSWYFGGRCQAFATGTWEEPFVVYDINSAYPWAMCSPHWHGPQYRVQTDLPDDPEVLATAMVALDATSRGALPSRDLQGRALQYSLDETPRLYHATGHEVIAGLETGTLDIERVREVRVPLATRDFTAYVEHFWEQKEAAERAGDAAQRHIAKIMLNGVYGKFAQDPSHFSDWQLVRGRDALLRAYSPSCELIELGGELWAIGNPSKVKRFYNVATAASITGQVRAFLWRSITQSEGVMYCDTDSIICRRAGFETGRKIGEWKEESRPDKLSIAGRKLYAYRCEGAWKVASKGVKLTAAEVQSVAKGATVVWQNEAPTFSWSTGTRFISRRIRRTEG